MAEERITKVIVKKVDGTEYMCRAIWDKKQETLFNENHAQSFGDAALFLVLDVILPELKLIGIQNIESIVFVRE